MKLRVIKSGLFIIIMSTLFLSACNFFQAKTVVAIEIDATTIEEPFDIDTFDLSNISILVRYSDNTTETIALQEAMLSVSDLALLDQVGEHNITITYLGKTTTLTIVMAYSTLKTQLMTFYNLAITQTDFTGTYEEWLASIQGPAGTDGREVEMQFATGFIQWRYQGDATWINLLDLSILGSLIGEAVGIQTIVINDDGHLIVTLSNDQIIDAGEVTGGAIIAPVMLQVTFDAQGGIMPSEYPNTVNVEKGSTLVLPIPTKESYLFEGWWTGDTVNDGKFTNYIPIATDMTLHAQWQLVDYYLEGPNTVGTGKTISLRLITDYPSLAINWSSSDQTIAIVDSSGRVTGVSFGTVVISCVLEGVGTVTKTIEVTTSTALTVGLPYNPSVNLFGSFWGANTFNMNIQKLTFGYSLFSYQKESDKYLPDPMVVKDLQVIDNLDGTKTYTIEINNDLKWNDGVGIDAKDYLFGIMLSLNPIFSEIVGNGLSNDYGILGGEAYADGEVTNQDGLEEFEGLNLINDYQFALTLPDYTYYLFFTNAKPYPRHVIAPNADIVQGVAGAKITGTWTVESLLATIDHDGVGYRYDISVTCGPYQLDEFNYEQQTAILKKNSYYKGNYEGQIPNIETLELKFVTASRQIEALVSGEIDLTGSISPISSFNLVNSGLLYVTDETIDVMTFHRNGYGQIVFHCDAGAGPTGSVAVRQALAYISNRELFLTTFANGLGIIPNGQYSLDDWMVKASTNEFGVIYGRDGEGNIVSLNDYSYNPALAVSLLEADGWIYNETGQPYVQATDNSSVRYRKVGEVYEPLIIAWGYSANVFSNLINSQIVENAKTIGMQITGQQENLLDLVINHLYGSLGDGYLMPEDLNNDGKWTIVDIPVYEKLDEWGNVIEADLRAFHMFNVGFAFNAGVFQPYETLSIEHWGYDGASENFSFMNSFYIGDQELQDAAEKMLTATSDAEYLYAWQQYQYCFNLLLPAIPMYAEDYHVFYNPALKNYELTSKWSFTETILYADVIR
ncbi:MAG: ABC transporter substrate-binding protein [Bacilli bacterium]